jgi:DNA-binding transcriptional MerR regulator
MEQLHLTSNQLLAAIRALDGQTLPVRTLAQWAASGVVAPSVAYPGTRGRYGVRLYNLSDLARARLVLRLRQGGVSMPRARTILAFLDAELREVFRPNTNASLVFDGVRAYVTRPGEPDIDVPSGQLRLRLAGCFVGVIQAARDARRTA